MGELMDNKGKKAAGTQLPAATLLCLAIVIWGLIGYWSNLQADLSVASCGTLANIMEQQRFTFASKLQDQENALKTYTGFFEDSSDADIGELLFRLNTVTSNSSFDFVSYVAPNGDTVESTGTRLNVADRDYFKRALAGETVTSDPVRSKVTGGDIVTFSTPIFGSGTEPTGVLVGIYEADSLANLLMPSFDGRGYTYIVNGSGSIIVKTKTDSTLALHSNLFEAFTSAAFTDFGDSASIVADVAANRGGHARYNHDGETRRMHFAPIGVNDWYIFSVAPDDAIAPQATGIMRNATMFIYAISILTLVGLSYFFMTQKKYLAELRRIAFVDSLTGGQNRKRFRLSAAEILASSPEAHAFVLLDIDKFKVLNDTLGYSCGDMLLVNIAQTFSESLGDSESFGRCDSDEFLALLLYTDDAELESRLREILSRVEAWFRAQYSATYSLVLSAGVYIVTDPMESINSISDRARHAHKLAKGKDSSAVCFYNDGMRRQILYEKEVENKMHRALTRGEFHLYLQPKFYLDSEKIYGAEALVRWDVGGEAIVYPDQFISIFEKNGFITKLDMYMLEQACIVLRGWLDAGVTPIPISINFSRMHLKNPNFVFEIAELVKQYAIPPELVEVELTESTMLNNEGALTGILTSLHECGFTLSMDDFGSGYSSLGLLKNLPVDVIKLDKSFLVDCGEQKRAVTVVASIISMAKKLGIKTVAEGVETKEQIDFLRGLGCDLVQGFYYARPMPAKDIDAFL